MPGLVMSTDVEPPIRTENSGMNVSRIALIFFRLHQRQFLLRWRNLGFCCALRPTVRATPCAASG